MRIYESIEEFLEAEGLDPREFSLLVFPQPGYAPYPTTRADLEEALDRVELGLYKKVGREPQGAEKIHKSKGRIPMTVPTTKPKWQSWTIVGGGLYLLLQQLQATGLVPAVSAEGTGIITSVAQFITALVAIIGARKAFNNDSVDVA